jgi:P4 family phage/plasmid primase-like protien
MSDLNQARKGRYMSDGQIQILGLRQFESGEKQGQTYDAFFKKNWRAPSVKDIFANPDKYLEMIPLQDRWNIYYTAALCTEEKRKLLRQEVMPFDIDGLDLSKSLEEYVEAICQALGINRNETGIIYTGNGLQFLIGLVSRLHFTDAEFFKLNREHYKALCGKIDSRLRELGLPGKADPTVFSAARILRMPNTENRKPKGIKQGKLLNGTIIDVDFDITQRSGLPNVNESSHIDPATFRRYPKADTKAVLEGCDFLKFCKEKPNEVNEAQWYAMLSITARLENGVQLSHEYSNGHRSYTHAETEEKIRQATQASGPRTCQDIGTRWEGCSKCPHFQKVNSPIVIRGSGFIRTESTGFHDISYARNGNPIFKPNYEDLRKFLKKERNYKTLGESKIVYEFNGKYYEEMPDAYLDGFAQEHFDPTATNAMRAEFRGIVQCTHLTKIPWFSDTTSRKINFDNGVLSLDTMELVPHSVDFGFRHCLGYAYDKDAKAPNWDKFLAEVTCKDAELAENLLQFIGYSLSNDSCWAQKALVLDGHGSNGKSTLMNVWKKLAGEKNYAAFSLADLRSESNRQMLDGKLFNMAEETPSKSLMESSIFKNLVSGGEVAVRQLYKNPYTMRNRAKLIFACNELPKTTDTTAGYFRRFIIIPFRAVFSNELGNLDPFIEDKLFAELPGIFNQAIAAYKRLLTNKKFAQSAAVDNALAGYRNEIDTAKRWIDENVTIEGSGFIPFLDLYQAYVATTETMGEEPITGTAFGKKLARLLPDGKNQTTVKKIDGKPVRGFIGITYSSADSF